MLVKELFIFQIIKIILVFGFIDNLKNMSITLICLFYALEKAKMVFNLAFILVIDILLAVLIHHIMIEKFQTFQNHPFLCLNPFECTYISI